jgi:nicotinate-nucleotide adenylyltransferase
LSPALGLFGGTFDPIHAGHLRLATEVREALGLGRVVFVPAGDPWQRASGPVASAAHRAEMIRLAIAGEPAFALDERELRRAGPTYTVDTLAAVRAEIGPSQPLVFLCGSDAAAGIDTWHRWEALATLAHIAVAGRAGETAGDIVRRLPAALGSRVAPSPAAALAEAAGAVIPLAMTPLAISSTDLRERLASGRSLRWLAPDAVLDYIHRNALYGVAA